MLLTLHGGIATFANLNLIPTHVSLPIPRLDTDLVAQADDVIVEPSRGRLEVEIPLGDGLFAFSFLKEKDVSELLLIRRVGYMYIFLRCP